MSLRRSFRSYRAPVRRRAAIACAVFASFATACATPSSTAEPKAAVAPPQAEDGTVTIAQASQSFIEVAELADTAAGSVTSAPARVEFRDGAVSHIGSPLDGRVVDVHVRVGEMVKSGQPLVTLDCPEAVTMRAAAPVAQASLREARLELERQRRMQREGVGIERDLVAAETRVSLAEAEVARVEATVRTIGEGTGASVIVHAPLAGVVITRKASVGQSVDRGDEPLVEIGDKARLWIVADVFERDLTQIATGAKVRTVLTPSAPAINGTVTSIGAIVAPELRTAPVFIAIDGPVADLRPGTFGQAEIAHGHAGVTLPVSAVLIKDGKDPVVYVQRGALTYVRTRVSVGPTVDGRVPIVSGLNQGDKVVVRGALLLDGAADQLL